MHLQYSSNTDPNRNANNKDFLSSNYNIQDNSLVPNYLTEKSRNPYYTYSSTSPNPITSDYSNTDTNDPFILNYLSTYYNTPDNSRAVVPNYYSTGTSINPKYPSNSKDVIPYSLPTSVNLDYPYTDPINAEI